MNERERRRWERMRRHGKLGFVLLWGVLAWGLPVGAAWPILMEFWNTGFNPQAWNMGRFAHTATGALLLFPVVGVPYGLILWHLNERRFRQ